MLNAIVCKFGGSSLADAAGFRRVRDIIAADARRRYVVVSAPGKRWPEDIKVTDLMLRACTEDGMDRRRTLQAVRRRFAGIARDLGISLPSELDRLEYAVDAGRDAAASRGECICAMMLAEFLGYQFAEAADIFAFRYGNIDKTHTYAALRRLGMCAVMPGFYGADETGNIVTFPRGGSDISAAHAAAGLEVAIYENWTDVEGFFTADPALVPDARRIRSMSPAQARLFASLGAGVLHSESIAPAAAAGIPIIVRSTFFPGDQGTIIAGDAECDMPCVAAQRQRDSWTVSCANISGDAKDRLMRAVPGGVMRGRVFAVDCSSADLKDIVRRLHGLCFA